MALSIVGQERRMAEQQRGQNPVIEYDNEDDLPALPLSAARHAAAEADTMHQRRRANGSYNMTQVNVQLPAKEPQGQGAIPAYAAADRCFFNCNLPKPEDVEYLDNSFREEATYVCEHIWFHKSCIEKVMRDRTMTKYRVNCGACKKSHKHKMERISIWRLFACCCCCCCFPRWIFSTKTLKFALYFLLIICAFGFLTKITMYYGASVPELRTKLANRTDSSEFTLFSYRYDCPINEDNSGRPVRKIPRFRDTAHLSMIANVRYSYFWNINLCHMILGLGNPIFLIGVILFLSTTCISRLFSRWRFKMLYNFKAK